MLLGYIGHGAVEGKSIGTWQVQSKQGYSGAATAIYIRQFVSDVAILNLMNYDWYALVSRLPRLDDGW